MISPIPMGALPPRPAGPATRGPDSPIRECAWPHTCKGANGSLFPKEHFSKLTEVVTSTTGGSDTRTDTLTITDNRTGKTWDLPIQDGCIRANDLRQIKVQPDEFGMMSYDPAFLNTAACRSSGVTYWKAATSRQECDAL